MKQPIIGDPKYLTVDYRESTVYRYHLLARLLLVFIACYSLNSVFNSIVGVGVGPYTYTVQMHFQIIVAGFLTAILLFVSIYVSGELFLSGYKRAPADHKIAELIDEAPRCRKNIKAFVEEDGFFSAFNYWRIKEINRSSVEIEDLKLRYPRLYQDE